MTIDFKAIFAEVKENKSTLDACIGPHDFKKDSDKISSRHICLKCGGSVNFSDAYWYGKGLKDAGTEV